MLITMLFTVGNLDDAINAASPFQNAFTNTGSQGLNTFLTLVLFLLILSGNITAVTTVSRETWAFARDGGLPFSRWIAKVSSSVGSGSRHSTPYLPHNRFQGVTTLR
jgi:choline transport protein